MEYEILCGKITTAERLADRFLNCQSSVSSDLDKTYMGRVYTLVEILSPWFPTAQVGQNIITNFTNYYYNSDSESTSDLVNFEESLKKVNQTLSQIVQNGETDWIGKLNAILAVVIENKIHLAQTGHAEVYIFRDGKVNHITYGLADSQIEQQPLKTFSNITSGELKSHDKILIANPELFKYLDIEVLRQIITLGSTKESILQIAKLLKRKKIKSINALVLEVLTNQEASKVAIDDLADTIHLDKPIESFSIWFERFWKQILSPILRFTKDNIKKIGIKTWELTKKTYSHSKKSAGQLHQKYQQIKKEKQAKIAQNAEHYKEPVREPAKEPLLEKKIIDPADLFEKEFMSEENNNNEGLLKDEEINYSPELKVHYYEQKQKNKNDLWKNISNNLMAFFNPIYNYAKKIVKFIFKRQHRSYLLILLAVIILSTVGYLVISQRGQKEVPDLSGVQNILKESEIFAKEAKTAIVQNDLEKGKQLYAKAIEKALPMYLGNNILKNEAFNIINSSYQDLDKLTNTTRFMKLEPILSLEQNPRDIFVYGNKVYFVTQNEIYQGMIGSSSTVDKVASLPKANGDFQFGTISDNALYLYTSSQKVYKLDLENKNFDLAKAEGTWETANNAAFYADNIYLLDGITGQIYKHAKNDDTFASGEEYISSPSINIKNGISLAIDGSLYILKNNSEVVKLQKSKLLDFTLKDIPTPWSKIEKPVKIYTDVDAPSIYILDAGQKRVLEFDKEGQFIHQYALPDTFDKINDFWVSTKSKKIWFTNDKSLYEFSI